MIINGRSRAVITNVFPEIEGGMCSIKRCIGDQVVVEADIFADSHCQISATVLISQSEDSIWQEYPMQLIDNDRWRAVFTVDELGTCYYRIQAWVDHFHTFQKDLEKKQMGGVALSTDIAVGIKMIEEVLLCDERLRFWYDRLINAKNEYEAFLVATDLELHSIMRQIKHNRKWVTEYDKTLSVIVEPHLARFSAWYELFPRSCSQVAGKHGTLTDCKKMLPEIAQMGFDIVYLPPIHPIGTSFRKGKNNQLKASSADPGSPWAIGDASGGHMAIHPLLGTEKEFEALVETAKDLGLHIALDIAFQCSPDHPYLLKHPEWFSYLPDGTIHHAENPPKKYEDIIPFNFETDQYQELWQELLDVVLFWIQKGVTCFRVDNPHTKPFCFWQWLIREVKKQYPEVIFLSEAFTRPKVMHWLAKIGFSQSYTYFTWRYTKNELIKYLTECVRSDVTDYFRPNFWPNTPDILPLDLQYYGKPAFMTRLILASTLSSNYGVYGPAYEQMQNEAIEGSEEYLYAEKYEIKTWKRNTEISNLMTLLNTIRRENPALQTTDNIQFHETHNNHVLAFSKSGPHTLVIVVNLDPERVQSVSIQIPYISHHAYSVHELLENRHFLVEGSTIEVTIDPKKMPAQIFKILTPLMREKAFDYFM